MRIAQETTEGIIHSDKTPPEVHEFPIPETEEQAEEVIKRFEEAAKGVRGDEDVSDNVAQHMLNDRTGLLDEKWLGSEEEELNAYGLFDCLKIADERFTLSYVTELLYIHSKVMIVDDRRVIVGIQTFSLTAH